MFIFTQKPKTFALAGQIWNMFPLFSHCRHKHILLHAHKPGWLFIFTSHERKHFLAGHWYVIQVTDSWAQWWSCWQVTVHLLESDRWHILSSPLWVPSNLIHNVFLWVLKGADIPANRAEHASLQTGLPFSDAVDLPEDGASQQDIDPWVQDLVTGGHPDTCHHQPPISVSVTAQGATVGPCGWHEPKDLKKRKQV